MSTVINLNILNFIRFKLNNHTVNDVRINNNFSDRKKDDSQANGMVVDVTPYNRAIEDRRDLMVRDMSVPDTYTSRAQLVMETTAADNTYDRRGNLIQTHESKGMHIDSYV